MNLYFLIKIVASFFLAAYFGIGCAPVQPPRNYDYDADYAQQLVKTAVVVKTTVTFTDDKGLHTGRIYGSGVVVGHKNGHTLVLTARHVCQPELGGFPVPADGLHVHTIVDRDLNVHGAVVVLNGREKDNDVCVLDAEDDIGRVADVADEMPPVGGRTTLVGAPMQNYDKDMIYVSDGRYCGMQRLGDNLEYYMETHSAPSTHGASGGPIFYRGRVVGINSMAREGFSDVAYAVPLWYVRQDIAEALKLWRV